MQIDKSQFLDAFFEEADEHLSAMEDGLLQLEKTPHDHELISGIFRAAHSIKGASGMLGFSDIIRFTHVMENLLDRMRDGDIVPSQPLINLLLQAADVLRGLVAVAQRGGSEVPEEMEEILAQLEQQLAEDSAEKDASQSIVTSDQRPGEESFVPDGERTYQVSFVPNPAIFHQGMDPLLLLRQCALLGKLTNTQVDTSRLPGLSEMDPTCCYLGWSLHIQTDKSVEDIQDVFAFVEDDSDIQVELITALPDTTAQPTPTRASSEGATSSPGGRDQTGRATSAATTRESSSIRVATNKVDKLINLIGELVITQSMISQLVENFSEEKLSQLRESVDEMSSNTRELQERVMAVRMLPVGSTFSRFPRMVRDLAATFEKQISLQVVGEETELDKGVLEKINDPLTHLIRNAADHGMETPDQRRASGKPEEGTIRLHAFHQGGSVIIEIADDGPGLDTERIRQKALDNDLIGVEDTLSDDQIYALIFQPGFSTAETVSDISGRGVGMDVVKRNIEALNGSISIASERGRGTRFRIKLPLTLAIIDGLSLRVGDEIYVLPLLSIIESIKPQPDHLKTVVGQGEVIVVRDEFLPFLRLYTIFDLTPRVTDPTQGLVVIIENEGRKFGLLVDELLGQSQVVIKNLETNFRKVEGVVGATIMGDGRAALILDVQGLARIAAREGGIPLSELEGTGFPPTSQEEEQFADEQAVASPDAVSTFTVPAAADTQAGAEETVTSESADGDVSEVS